MAGDSRLINGWREKSLCGYVRYIKKTRDIVCYNAGWTTGACKNSEAGIIRAAQKTGAVIVPAAGQSTKSWVFSNWDKFYLTKPFGKIVQIYSEPLFFEKTDDFDICVERLTKALNKTEKEAERRVWMEKSD